MTTAKSIALSRKHLAVGNEHGYKAMMATDIRSALSTRKKNAILKAIEEDGYTCTNTACPTTDDIVFYTNIFRESRIEELKNRKG